MDFKQAVHCSYQNYIIKAKTYQKKALIPQDQIPILADRLGALDEKEQSVLIMRYVYKQDYAVIDDLLNISDAEGICVFYRSILSDGYNQLVSEECMAAACGILETKMISLTDIDEDSLWVPSKKANKELKKLFAPPQYRLSIVILRKVTAVLVALLLTLLISLTASASLRKKLLGWVVEIYEKFGSFGYQTQEVLTIEDMLEYQPHYIPDEFTLTNEETDIFSKLWEYSDGSTRIIWLYMQMPEASPLSMNTEGAALQEIQINDIAAYYWRNLGSGFMVWQTDGFSCYLVSDLDYEEMLKIAENLYN